MTFCLTIIRNRIFDILDGEITGVSGFADRAESDAFGDMELPAWVLRPSEFRMQRQTGANVLEWEGDIDVDILSDAETNASITETHGRISADIVALVQADMGEASGLGGMLTYLEPSALSSAEDVVAEVGGVVLSFLVRFETPANDWNKIIGPAGTFT